MRSPSRGGCAICCRCLLSHAFVIVFRPSLLVGVCSRMSSPSRVGPIICCQCLLLHHDLLSAFVVACVRHRAWAPSFAFGVCSRMRSSSGVGSIPYCRRSLSHALVIARWLHYLLSAFVVACGCHRASAPSFAVSVCCCRRSFIALRLHHLLRAFVVACVRHRASTSSLAVGVCCFMRSPSRVGFITCCWRLLSHAVAIARRFHDLLSARVVACTCYRASASPFVVGVICRIHSHRASAASFAVGICSRMCSSSCVGFTVCCRRLLSRTFVIADRLHHSLFEGEPCYVFIQRVCSDLF